MSIGVVLVKAFVIADVRAGVEALLMLFGLGVGVSRRLTDDEAVAAEFFGVGVGRWDTVGVVVTSIGPTLTEGVGLSDAVDVGPP